MGRSATYCTADPQPMSKMLEAAADPPILACFPTTRPLFYLEVARGINHEIDRPTETHSEILKQIFKISSDLYKLVQSKKNEDLFSDI